VNRSLEYFQHLAGQSTWGKVSPNKNTTQPRLWLEVTLLGLLPAANSDQLMVSVPERGIHREVLMPLREYCKATATYHV